MAVRARIKFNCGVHCYQAAQPLFKYSIGHGWHSIFCMYSDYYYFHFCQFTPIMPTLMHLQSYGRLLFKDYR